MTCTHTYTTVLERFVKEQKHDHEMSDAAIEQDKYRFDR